MLENYKDRVDQLLLDYERHLGGETPLKDACCYSLRSGGKRLRPIICVLVAESLGKGLSADIGGLSIELFHTASLVADDLPCMDDDDERRNQPSCHQKYGEGMALLVSYALIAAGYDCLYQNAEQSVSGGLMTREEADRACSLSLGCAARCTGIHGATGGQFLDLCHSDLTEELLIDILDKKTGALFELSFAVGWLFGGGDPERLHEVCELGVQFGRAFQIADDLGDVEEDAEHEGSVNFAVFAGVNAALGRLEEELSAYQKGLKRLDIATTELEELGHLVAARAEARAVSARKALRELAGSSL